MPDLAGVPASLRKQLTAYSASIDRRLPPEAAHVFLICWTRLYGLLCMEILHQLDFAYPDLEPVFEECLRDLTNILGWTALTNQPHNLAAGEHEPPKDALVHALLEVWRTVLGVPVNSDDDFFDLGGNSLLAVRVAAKFRERRLPALPLRSLYRHPTIRSLVEATRAHQAE